MTHLYFHCGHADELFLDLRGADVGSLAEAHDHALKVAQDMMASAYGPIDFSDWFVCVGDERDEGVLVVPFAAARPTLH